MYTNTKHIFLVFQWKDNVESLSEMPISEQTEVMWNWINDVGSMLSKLGIKWTVDRSGMSDREWAKYAIKILDAWNGQEKGILTVSMNGKTTEIQIPPEKLFQKTYELQNFNFTLQKSQNTEDNTYFIVDSNGKKLFTLSTNNIDNFQNALLEFSLDLASEVYDIDREDIQKDFQALKERYVNSKQENSKTQHEMRKLLLEEIYKTHQARNIKVTNRTISADGATNTIDVLWENTSDANSGFENILGIIEDFVELQTRINVKKIDGYTTPTNENTSDIWQFLVDNFISSDSNTK